MIIIKKVAIANPSVPPFSRPRFQPKYIPDITYPTPNPHSIAGVSVRFRAFSGGEDKKVKFTVSSLNIGIY
jgi:hypothetical protein